MVFPELSKEHRKKLAKQIAELIDAFTSEGRLGDAPIPPNLDLYESCQEVILDLPREWKKDLLKPGASIEQWIRPQATWYHQLRAASQVFGFARSIEVEGPAGRSHRVIEVVPSTVAHEFQNAVHFVDTEEPEAGPPGSEPSVFLLHVPRYAFYSLATAGAADPEKGVSKITLVCPFFRERLPVTAWKQASLPALLGDLPDAFGASDLEPSRLHPFSGLHRQLRPKRFR